MQDPVDRVPAPPDELLAGEPLICDGIELPVKHRKKRLDLEARGLIKGAQVVYLGPGKRPGFSRLHVTTSSYPTDFRGDNLGDVWMYEIYRFEKCN